MIKITSVLFYALLAILFGFLIDTVQKLDLNKRTLNHAPRDCLLVDGVNFGSEDIELINVDKSALITSGVKYLQPVPGAKGRVFRFDFTTRTAEELKFSKGFDKDRFIPHGMSKYITSDGRIFIYIVNHGSESEDVIDKFLYDPLERSLNHIKSIKHKLIYSINDLVIVGEDQFYVTNDHYFRQLFLKQFEDFFLPFLGNLIYFDGKKAQVVLSSLAFPNSPAISRSQNFLYLTLPISKTISIYKYNKGKPLQLEHVNDIVLMTACDNLFVDHRTGDIWSGCHPNIYQALKHLRNPLQENAPSQVVHIQVNESKNPSLWKIFEAYSDDGSNLKGSASAVRVDGNILIGTVHHKLMHCKI